MDTRLRLEEMLPRIIASEKETTNFYKFRTNFLEAWSSGSQSEYELQLQFQSKIKFLEFFSLQNLNFSALFAFLDRHLSDEVFW